MYTVYYYRVFKMCESGINTGISLILSVGFARSENALYNIGFTRSKHCMK